MSKRSKRGKKGSPAAYMMVLLGALCLGSLAAYVKTAPAVKVPDELRREESRPPANEAPPPAKDRVMVPKIDGETVRMVEGNSQAPKSIELVARAALKELELPSAVLRGISQIGDKVTLDFTEELPGSVGSMQEATFLRTIRMAFGQFEDVKVVALTIDGQPVDSLGHFEILEPLTVIRQRSTTIDEPRP